jgi:hypothetical protein
MGILYIGVGLAWYLQQKYSICNTVRDALRERMPAVPKAEHAVKEWPMAGGLLFNADWSSLAGIYVEVKDAKEIVFVTQHRVARLGECGCASIGMCA